jgi:hypothetical protein
MKRKACFLTTAIVLFALHSFSSSANEEYRVTITGYNISVEGEKQDQVIKLLESFPLKGKTIFEAAKEIDESLTVKKEFEFYFSTKDNILCVVEPVLEWGKIHLEIKVIPNLINDVICEFNIEETPKWWEEKERAMIKDVKMTDEEIEKNKQETIEELKKLVKEKNMPQIVLERETKHVEQLYAQLKGQIGPKSKLEGGRMMFKLGTVNALYGHSVQKEITQEGRVKTFSNLRTILIERR